MTPDERHRWFFNLAQVIAEPSVDRSLKVGCVIVGPDKEVRAQGYNGFPRGLDDATEEWHKRPTKYLVTVHAEANAVVNAARTGTSIKGCTAYVTAPPCSPCAALLINAGIAAVYWLPASIDMNSRWRESLEMGLRLFREAGIEYGEFKT